MAEEELDQKRLADEDLIFEKIDGEGKRWRKVYFGGGAHFRNWLDQTVELCGEENVQVEEADPRGLKCFEEGGEKLFRIWVREGSQASKLT